MHQIGIGLQLYTLRDEMAADMKKTLTEAAELGYEGVEFAGYFGMEANKLRDLLDQLNLKAIGSHISLQRLRENLSEEITYLKTIGGRYLICPSIPEDERKSPEDWVKISTFFQTIGEEAQRHGLQFAYHNHAFEFDIQVGDQFAFDSIYSSTDPKTVQVELDICWVQFAGQEPVAYIQKYADRLPLLHLKDFNKDENGKIITLELGQGLVQLADVISASTKAGVEWLIVEQDKCQNPPLQSVSNSMEWLITNGVIQQ
jgi:sugar phosphate isomerase/epimerase